MEKVLIHHSEIGLKKGNFDLFETQLLNNIKSSFWKNKIKISNIKRTEKRIIAEVEAEKEKIILILKKVFGIKHFSFIEEIERDLKKLEKKVEEIIRESKIKKIAFKTKRSDKNYLLTSVEINENLGKISNETGVKVDYSNPEKTIFIEVLSKKFLIYTERFLGLGGLPVGTSGKILCLLSGGIDSPVATFLMMKRGCTVDFLHFHTFRTNSDVLKTKINRLVDILNNYQDESKLYLIPYSGYEIFSQNKLWEKYDLIAFKYYMIKLAEKFALEKYYDAIITGDNLGQVASQTIENLKISSVDLKIPLFRPLITYDKQEIIDLAKKIGTYEMSIEKYKDCCSILSKNPSTRTSQEKFTEIMKNFDLDFLIEKSLKEIEKFDVK